MTLCRTIAQLRTTDLEASIRFYTEQIGLPLAFRHADFYAGIGHAPTLFHLKLVDERDPVIDFVEQGDHFHLYLQSDNAKGDAEAMRGRGVHLAREVHDTAWGTREFVVKDNQGHTVYVGQPL